MIVFIPDEQTLLTVVHGTPLSTPPLIEACRAGACPNPADTTFPKYTSFISLESSLI